MQTSQSTRPDVISVAGEERANDVVLGAVLGLWDVVNSLTRLQPSRRTGIGLSESVGPERRVP